MSTPFAEEDRIEDRDLFVSPEGDDAWSGEHAAPTEDGTDGPLATLERARTVVLERAESASMEGPMTVWVRGGRYELSRPLEFSPASSVPVTFAAYPGEEPIVDGGRRIDDWTETEVNGTTAWVADLPDVADGDWYFRSLFVDGERRPRARLPKGDLADLSEEEFRWIRDVPGRSEHEDFSKLFEGTTSFEYAPGDVDPEWRNPTDIDVVALHYWIEERLPVAEIDAETNRVTSTRRTAFMPVDDARDRFARYYVENVFEALSEPGEWYLDRAEGRLYYVPREDETPAETDVVAPHLTQFVRFEGDPDADDYVEDVGFHGLTFRHADWEQPTSGFEQWEDLEEGDDLAAAPQAAIHVPGVVEMEGTRRCRIEDCTIEHVGWYAVELGDGCRTNRIVGNRLVDLGAGGVKLSGADVDGPRARRTGHNRITDNEIGRGGRVFHSAVGILARRTFDNEISHNHVHDLYYTGISCGWSWGYDEHVARDNRIEYNHIHDLGQGLLSDMGGIYLLGVQPGTVLRGNHIHGVEKHNYGGWAIYLDEGSAHVVVEENVCHDTSEYLFFQHYGRENVVRNNVFAFGADGVIGTQRDPIEGVEWKRQLDAEADHDRWNWLGEKVPSVLLSNGMESKGVTFHRNVLVTDGRPLFAGSDREFGSHLENRGIDSDGNVFWDVSGEEPFCANVSKDENADQIYTRTFDLAEWRELGYDRHSVVERPGFRDLANRIFELEDGSAADEMGVELGDIDRVGPRS